MKKKIILIVIIVLIVISTTFIGIKIKDKKEQEAKIQELKDNQKRYEKIKEDINKKVENYLSLTSPNCLPNSGGTIITHKRLVGNGGMDKGVLLDVDKKSYCGVTVNAYCTENGENAWDLYLSCKDYEDEGYVEWAAKFPSKN